MGRAKVLNIEWEDLMTSINFDHLTKVAEKYHMELVRDPFHGAKAFELRRAENKRYLCVGAILDLNVAEVYRRYLDRRSSFIHRRLWFLEWIFPVAPESEGYEVLARLPEEQASFRIEEFLQEEFESSDEDHS